MATISNTGFWEFAGPRLQKEHMFDAPLCEEVTKVMKENGVQTAYDFGCGLGQQTAALNQAEIACTGFDGNPHTATLANCEVFDLTKPLGKEPVDSVLCLEVGEHIPKEFEAALISNLTESVKSKGLLILSWAIVGQTGLGHVNCQNNPYVKNLIVSKGFAQNSELTIRLRRVCSLGHFKNTIIVFQKL